MPFVLLQIEVQGIIVIMYLSLSHSFFHSYSLLAFLKINTRGEAPNILPLLT